MLRSPLRLSDIYHKLKKQSKNAASTDFKQLKNIFQTHNCLIPDEQLSLQLLEKQRKHQANLDLCESIKKWYLSEIKNRVQNGIYSESCVSCFDQKYVVSPFGSQAT